MKALLAVGLSNEEMASLEDLLTGRGWKIRAAAGWTQVFLRLREGPYRAVICQSILPDGDWRDVLDELWLCTSPPPLIVTSRLADASLWVEVLDAGGFNVLASPFEASEVVYLLTQVSPLGVVQREPRLIPARLDSRLLVDGKQRAQGGAQRLALG